MAQQRRKPRPRASLDSTVLHSELVENEAELIDKNHRTNNYLSRNDLTVDSIDLNLLQNSS